MTILAPAPRRVKFEARTETDGSILINGTAYHVEPIPAGEFGTIAFRLSKQAGAGEVYDVIRTHGGLIECDCPDYEARHRGNGFGCCKHGKALVELGMVPAAGPDESHLAELEPEWSILPRTDGSGLEPEELARLHRQRDRVVAAYRAAAPEADAVDLRRVAENAAKDALRSILRSRPVAGDKAILTPGVTPEVTPGVVEMTPPAMVTNTTVDPGDVESDPEDWGPEWDNWFWVADEEVDPEPEPEEPRLSLLELIELQARRWRAVDSGAGDLIGDRLERLVREIQATSAHHPVDVDARLEVLELEYA